MQFGMIGLGRMGAGMVRRLRQAGHDCVVYDRAPAAVAALVAEGATGSESLADFVAALAALEKIDPAHAGPESRALLEDIQSRLTP